MNDDFVRKMACTLYVIAGYLLLQLLFGRRPLRVGSNIVGVLWLIAAAAILFWPTLNALTRVAGVLLVILLALVVSEAASGFVALRYALDGSLPWSNLFSTTLFTAAVELVNITIVVGLGWLASLVAKKIVRTPSA